MDSHTAWKAYSGLGFETVKVAVWTSWQGRAESKYLYLQNCQTDWVETHWHPVSNTLAMAYNVQFVIHSQNFESPKVVDSSFAYEICSVLALHLNYIMASIIFHSIWGDVMRVVWKLFTTKLCKCVKG